MRPNHGGVAQNAQLDRSSVTLLMLINGNHSCISKLLEWFLLININAFYIFY